MLFRKWWRVTLTVLSRRADHVYTKVVSVKARTHASAIQKAVANHDRTYHTEVLRASAVRWPNGY